MSLSGNQCLLTQTQFRNEPSELVPFSPNSAILGWNS